MTNVYPVIFTQVDEKILIEVPDLNILTEGLNIADAIEMARDAIGLKVISLQDDSIDIPPASQLDKIRLEDGKFTEFGNSYISLVDIDFVEYRKKIDNKTVRRNVTLPNWLNQEAEKAHLNVSKVLQEALMLKLNTSR